MAILTIPTLSQKLAYIRKQIRETNKNISTVPGSGGSDAFVTPLAIVDVGLEAQAFYLSVSESITELLALKVDTTTLELMARAYNIAVSDVLVNISQTLDKFGANYKESRRPVAKSSGTVKFGRPDPPDQDYVIATGSVVKASNGAEFATTADATMYAASAAQYFDANLFLYVIDVPVEAVLPGIDGNVPATAVNTVVTPVNGFPYVINTDDISGGLDLESDENYGARILLKWQSIGRVTPAGIRLAILDNTGVTDVYLAKPGDPLATRGFGRADVYIKEKTVSSFTEIFTAYNSTLYGGCVIPTRRPLIAVTSTDSGVAFLHKDDFSVVAGSTQSQDVIRFSAAPTFPVSITYEYDAEIDVCQTVFDDDANSPITQQVVTDLASAMNTALLAKACLELDVDYAVTIQIKPGYLKASVVAEVQNNILTYGGTLTLGQSVYLSDINEIVEGTDGVLRIQGGATKFSPSNESGVSLVPITPAPNELVVFLNVNIF